MKSKLFGLAPSRRAFAIVISLFTAGIFFTASVEAKTPAISVTASTPVISEGGSPATFRISRDCCVSGPLTISFQLTGSATNGVDYVAIGSSVTIPASASSVLITVTPYDDLIVESTETVVLSISSGTGYKVGRARSATISIEDNDSTSAPSAPSNLSASNTTQNSTVLQWTVNSTNETGFVIEQSTYGGAYQPLSSVGAGVSTFIVGGLSPSADYTFRVGATGGTVVAYSAPVTITTIPTTAVNALYVSTLGSDSNSGTSPQLALRTINAALVAARPGTVININAGTYHEHVITRTGGLPGQDIVLTSYNGPVTLDGSSLPWSSGTNQNQGIVELRHPNVVLRNLKIVNSKNTGVVLDADNLTVENCEMAETQRHVISTDTRRQLNYPGQVGTMIRNITIRNNTVYRGVLKGQGYGQAISLIADGFIVGGNTVRNNMTEGIDIWLGSKHGEVVDNIVHGNGMPGIYVDGASYIRIHRNRVYNNAKGIGVSSENVNYSTSHIWIYNNLVYDHPDLGIFIWDSKTTPGYPGSQNVVIANNTIINNKISVCMSGSQNSATIINNLGYATSSAIYNSSSNSTYNIYSNVWMSSAAGFVDPANKNFRLLSTSPGLDAGAPLPLLLDDLGNQFRIDTDFDGSARQSGSAVDAGAFEYTTNLISKARNRRHSRPPVGKCDINA